MKDLKQSTKQRFGALDFSWPVREAEIEIVRHEAGVEAQTAARLVEIGQRSRRLKGHGLDEGVSTRMLIHPGSLIARGVEPLLACSGALVRPITDDRDMREALDADIRASFRGP